jgi:predicted extracellular nuclease
MRKRIFAALSFAVACAASTVLNAAPFTPGNIVVYRIGDGSAALTSNATAVFLDEYTTTGTLVQSIALPTAINGAQKRLTASGTATSDGYISRSTDARYIVGTGYEAALGTSGITGATAAAVNRTVARVYADGTVDTSTALTDAASSGNFRGAASTDGSGFWVTGSAGGIRYAAFSMTTSTQISTSFTNLRVPGIFGGQLYVSASTGAFRLGNVGTGTPTAAGNTITNLTGLPTTGSPYGYFFADLDAGVAGVDTLYVADDGGTIIKYSLVAGTWTLNNSIASASARGLAGSVSGNSVTLYATQQTATATVVTFTDNSGYNANMTGTPTTIVTAGTNRTFRGIALTPEVPVTVIPSAGANGTITPNIPQAKLIGQIAQFTVTPDATYTAVMGGTCGGTLVGNIYTTNVLTADCTVDATFTSSPTFTVTPSASANGTISPNTPQTVNSGDTAVFTVTPATNYIVVMGGTCGGVLNVNIYTTAAVTADCTVTATFNPITHTVTPSAGANGTISPSTPQTINQGTTTTFTVTPDSGFSASVGGTCGGTLVGTTYTTAVITGPCTVDATFAPLPIYTVMGTAGANGSIAPTMAQAITQGNTAVFTITPNAGYNTAVRGTCGGTLVGTTYTTRPITANCTVDAVFSKKLVLFVGNSYTFGRIDPVMSYNTANVTDLTQAMWIADPTGSNPDEPHPWGGIPGVFKKMTDQLSLEYDVSISARNAASLRGHYLNTNPANWDLRGNVATQRWNAVVLQDLSDQPLPAGRSPNANLPYFNAYTDKFEAWVHTGAAETYTETDLFGGGNAATCATVTGASTGTCNTVRTVSPTNAHANAAADVYLYQTWARPDLIAPNGTNAGGTTYSAAEGLELQTSHFADAYFGRAAGNANIKAVNPVGNAFLLAVTSGIAMRDPYVPEVGKINLWHTDYFHPSKYGSYLSALVHLAMISGIDPTTLGAGELAAIDLSISSTDAVALQQVAKAAVVPPAPAIGTAIPGNGEVTVSFTAANNVGRLALTGFTATCGAQSNTGATSPIVVSGLANGVAVTCTVTASNSVGTGLASAASNSATPATSVAFTSSAPTGGSVGVAYSFTVTANGTPAPTFSVTAGALPTGLALATDGLISGTPTIGGTFTGTITATNGSSSDTQNFSITIAPGAQIITFPTLASKVLGDAPFNAVAVASSGLTVIFSSTTTGVCTTGGTNGANITIVAAGTCTIAADQAGDSNFAPATQVLRSFNIAATSGSAIVISQVYGGGGNAGSVYRNDFIELFNRSGTPVDVSGWSVQYASAAGTTWQATPLNGTIPPGGYYLVQEAIGSGGTTNLPTPDATGTIAMSGTAGKVLLANIATALSGCLPGANVVDFVGFGATASCFEGAGPTPAPSNANSVIRAGSGCTDTNANNTDFSSALAAPRNSGSATNACSSLPGLSVSDVSLAEGNAGTTTFAFTVSLSTPAGAGGVLFDIATANGSATAGIDYASQSLTSVTIPQGMTSYTFNVSINGDIIAEGNETFTVNVTNLAGANLVKGTGTGTIANDDAGVDLNINDISANEGDSGTTSFTFTVSLAGPAPAGGVDFDIATANGTASAGSDYVSQVLTSQNIPAGMTSYTFSVTVNGDTSPEQNETLFVNVTNVNNAIGVKTQGVGTIVNDDAIRIHTVQGGGNTSPFAGQVVTVEGVVTFVSQGTNSLLGYFIQEPDANADADPATSEGVFVFTNATPASVNIGDLVRVTGTVAEFGTAPNTLTEIGNPTLTPTTQVLSSNNGLPAFTTVTLPVSTQGDLERYEGMRVRFMQTLTVSDHFDLAQYGEITVTANGRAIQPTNEVDPNDNPASGNSSSGTTNVASVNAALDLARRNGVIIDGSYGVYPSAMPFLDPMTNTIRLGSTVSDVTGIMSQIGGTHRIYPDVAPVFTYASRPAAPPAVGGNVKVASMNVLNYFNGNGLGAGFPTSRGANTLNEFNRQRAKVLSAVGGVGADVIGLLEIENDGTGADSAIQDLINGLNAAHGAGTWAFIADPAGWGTFPGTTDEIRSAIIYKPGSVTPVGASFALNDAVFNQARAPVTQKFRLNSNSEEFTFIINHFKSKASGSGVDADQNDGQGRSNNARRLQASALVSFINGIAATHPRVITMGDFNAYEQEDPMDILRAGGLTPLINNDPSYLFDGLSGSLDHALANPTLLPLVAGAAHWHINADEPVLLDYNVENKVHPDCPSAPCTNPDLFAADAFRASDHDPVLVGLQLNAPDQMLTVAVSGNGSGTITGTGINCAGDCSETYVFNSMVTLTATPSTGSTFTSWSGACTGNGGCSVTMDVAKSVTATFTLNIYTATASAGANGSIAPASQSVNHGATTTFTVTPDAGYTASVSGTCGGSLSGTTFTTAAVTADCSVAATFTLNSYSVTSSSGGNGTISPAMQTINHGATAQFTVTPDAGYTASVGGTCGGSQSGNTFTTAAITGPCSVAATFTLNSYSVTSSSGGNGTITPVMQTVNHGATAQFTVTPDAGYTASVGGTCGGSLSGNTFTTAAITGACNVATTFTLNTYQVSATAGANGVVSPATQSVNHGATAAVTITPDAGYVASISSTCGGSLSGNTYTTAAVTGACSVAATFVPLVTFNIVLEGAQETPANNSAGVGSGTAVIDTVNNTITLNLTFSGLTGTVNNAHLHGPAMRGMAAGVKIGISQASPITDVLTYSETDEADILAGLWYVNIHSTVFPGGELRGQMDNLGAADKTLTVSVTGTGTITGAGISCPGDCSETYAHVTMVTLTAAAGTGFTFTGWSGACSGTAGCTVTMDALKSVSATFAINTYTVTAGAGANGSISPSGNVSVAHGNTAVFTVTPSAGFSASVGGTCTGSLAGNTYTTAAVTGNCTVVASFAFIPVAPDAPVIGTAIAGNGQATVSFTPPGFDGGTAITGYTATCGTQSVVGTSSPLTVTGLTNFVTVNCSVIATNGVGSSPVSATVSVTPQPDLALASVVSRKTHAASGTYDVVIDTAIAIGGAVTVESRAIGAGHTIVFQFNVPITAAGTAAVVDTTSASAGSASAVQVGNDVVVTLTGVTDNQRVLVTLAGVNGTGNFEAAIGFLIGDVNNSRAVNATDIAGIKARSGQTTDASNFRFDLNASGGINATDIAAVKARSGLVLP